MADNAYAVALLWAWMAEHPEYYCSWVRPFTQLRWSPGDKRFLTTRVGGHWRRLALWARVVQALNCTCKFERLVVPVAVGAPPSPNREKWNNAGEFIPVRYRVLVWT